MYYMNQWGCFGAMMVAMVLFLVFTRLIFATPLGLILLGYLAYRMLRTRKPPEDVHYDSGNFNQSSAEPEKDPENFFDNGDFVDIDFEEVDDD